MTTALCAGGKASAAITWGACSHPGVKSRVFQIRLQEHGRELVSRGPIQVIVERFAGEYTLKFSLTRNFFANSRPDLCETYAKRAKSKAEAQK